MTTELVPAGYYALISSPINCRFWNGLTWTGPISSDASIDCVGFVDSLELVPIQLVEEESEEPQWKFCISCSCKVPIQAKYCSRCESPSFAPDNPMQPESKQDVSAGIGAMNQPQISFCTKCGTNRIDHGKFCAKCGQQFPSQQICPTCGQALKFHN